MSPIVLASVKMPRYQMGVETAHLLLAAANGSIDAKVVDLRFRLRLGESILGAHFSADGAAKHWKVGWSPVAYIELLFSSADLDWYGRTY